MHKVFTRLSTSFLNPYNISIFRPPLSQALGSKGQFPQDHWVIFLPALSSSFSTSLSGTDLKILVHLNPAKKKMDPSKFHLNSAILRYLPGSERFQFSFSLKSGKQFNFDRAVTESLASFQERILANMLKKFKGAEIKVDLVLPPGYQPSDPLKPFLDHVVSSPSPDVVFQINASGGRNILVNPPEIFQVKFHDKAFINFPIHPAKIESSQNLKIHESRFNWEFSHKNMTVKNKPVKSQEVPRGGEEWTACGENMVLFPGEELEGAHLRLTCIPSDGQRLGEPFVTQFPNPVGKIAVAKLLYEERLARLHPIDPQDPTTLRVMSYNILADTYTTPEWFNNSPVESLDYSYRLPLLEKEIAAYEADIICLQEVDEKTYTWDLEPFLRETKNLEGTFSCKYGNTKEGIASFFNPSKLRLISSDTVKITESMQLLPFWSQLEAHEGLKTRLEDRNTVLQISVLESQGPDKSLLVLGVTHLYFHPTADHIRLLQTIVCIHHIEQKVNDLRALFKDRKIRVLFAGDFNCTPPYSSFRLVTTGEVRKEDDDWISHETERIIPGLSFQHGLNLRNSHPGEELTNVTLNFEGCIDYIFYQADAFQVIRSYPPPNKATIATILGCEDYQVSLPNFHAPSDHLPIITDFSLL